MLLNEEFSLSHARHRAASEYQRQLEISLNSVGWFSQVDDQEAEPALLPRSHDEQRAQRAVGELLWVANTREQAEVDNQEASSEDVIIQGLHVVAMQVDDYIHVMRTLVCVNVELREEFLPQLRKQSIVQLWRDNLRDMAYSPQHQLQGYQVPASWRDIECSAQRSDWLQALSKSFVNLHTIQADVATNALSCVVVWFGAQSCFLSIDARVSFMHTSDTLASTTAAIYKLQRRHRAATLVKALAARQELHDMVQDARASCSHVPDGHVGHGAEYLGQHVWQASDDSPTLQLDARPAKVSVHEDTESEDDQDMPLRMIT